MATSPSSPHRPGHAHVVAVAVASTGWFDIARRALLAAVTTVASGLLNTGPEVNAATDGAEDSVDQEEAGGTSPSHVLLFLPSWELLTAPFPEDASFTAAPVQEASHPMTPNPLPQVSVQSSVVRPPVKLEFQSSVVRPPGKLEFQSSVVRPPGKLEFKRESIIDVVTEAPPAQHVRPLLGRNKRWRMCDQLPLRDNALSAFVVKASELLVPTMLALQGTSGAAVLGTWVYRKQAFRVSACKYSDWQICVGLAPFVTLPVTVWVSSMAKADEHDRNCLGVTSGFVIAFFVWTVSLGGIVVHCLTGANIFIIFAVVGIMIAIMFVTWTMTFSRPKILRRLLYCWGYFGIDPAAARTTVDDRIAEECNDTSFSATAAFAAQLTSKDKADIAKARADEAREIQAKAVQELADAKNRAERASSDLKKTRKRVSNDEADAGSSVQLVSEARYACAAALKAHVDATRRARKAVDDAHNKMGEFRAADEEAKLAATDAQAKYERAETAMKFWEL